MIHQGQASICLDHCFGCEYCELFHSWRHCPESHHYRLMNQKLASNIYNTIRVLTIKSKSIKYRALCPQVRHEY